MFHYLIILNKEVIHRFPNETQAFSFLTLKRDCGYEEPYKLVKFYVGQSYDPILHYPRYYETGSGWSEDKEFSEYVWPSQKPCQSRWEAPPSRYKGSHVRLEWIDPSPKCINKKPSHWPESASALRWLGSGGDGVVFGNCNRDCPLLSL